MDQFRATHPPLNQLPELYETQFVNRGHADAIPLRLPEVVRGSTAIAVVRVLNDDLDTTWSEYRTNFGETGAYFGVAGRSRLAIEDVLKGDATSLTPVLTKPFFIVADDQCKPAVALPAVSITDTFPVFQGERAVVFVRAQALVAEVPIDAQGNIRLADRYHIHLWEPSRTGQELIDNIRRLLLAPASPTS